MNRIAVGALLASVFLGGCDDVPPVGNYAVVYGRVYDATTNRPLAGVTVTVDSVDVATTADDGTYRILNVPVGPTDAAVNPPAGYAVVDTTILTFSVRAGDTFHLDLPMTGSLTH